ncbi:glucose-6-phosphate dehydrogenase [Ketogulonicigenium vulgare]|uniref:Glucose-6-phosphate 1-dehydrogenase n=1 Tax=Ketogulonicigenium vulgare (strain WSH-001) TaxID=759362 RepID=F9Y6U6_KETVW|nr:glucose-6-phosphate dehydrogenase [Ketogulonicigenium vulgare]ADO42775.1 glucose-6-phosphate 1-dehydrogenase [Ketogulonicigenium vulgare Y25]AEM40963.1 Glucose-6-phosphate 1-dehydrogenase [Ketogulonicigenium vulgare WSH-001]ALJ81112.1 glucose-6-phosphate dehydrogenase [Ketogulonicigenium vulgare]ANW33862.1 glucose-6-phosphate dehydrogenase [Ketogulonicigenium vulgare]AOZ54687.1 glucose-6-phosphate dehydrogenase [Ketogulonicigenium vulgare]
MASRVIPVAPFDLVVFGGTGDLAKRKIIPALFRRFVAGQFEEDARIIGAARAALSGAEYRTLAEEALKEFSAEYVENSKEVAAFLHMLDYVSIDATGDGGWEELKAKTSTDRVQAFYFSVAPSLFGALAERLHSYQIAGPEARVVVEKPFGRDQETAKALNATLAEYFDETQIYRIDHYLGKETVQNLMALRFGNMMFEPLWNNHYIDHIQITVAETVGVGGRGAYYDKSGAMRDMVQNHLMQLLCLIAMEPPAIYDADAVRDEKLKVIRALQPVAPHHIVRGQYEATDTAPSYRDDAENPRSFTESFIAMRCEIANWRWAGVPFYLRTGKKLRARSSEIAVVFKALGHSIFEGDTGPHRNILSIRLQPNEGIDMTVTVKEPGPGGMRLIDVPLDLTFAEAMAGTDSPEAYERLIMDVIRGNQTLFMRGDEVEAAWRWTDPLINGWEARNDVPKQYVPGSSGPEDALMLLHRDGRRWRDIKA